MKKIYGPYTAKDGRTRIVVYDTKTQEKKTVSYPKFLVEQKIGRKLTSQEVVHHKDGNPLNNITSNLQVAKRSKHSSSHMKYLYAHNLIHVQQSVEQRQNSSKRILGEKNINAKFTNKQVKEWRLRYFPNKSAKQLIYEIQIATNAKIRSIKNMLKGITYGAVA